MSSNKQYSGNPYQTPVKLRTNAPRQTEEQTRQTTRQRTPPAVPDVEEDDALDDGWTVSKPHTGSVRYDPDYPYLSPRTNRQDRGNPKRTQLVRERRPMVGRLLIFVGVGLFLVILGVMAIQAVGTWWQRHTDDVTYGYPRTYQTDHYVEGHGDSQAQPNHFIAFNLNGVIEVVEINPPHPQLNKTYYVTAGTDPLKPVTLSFPTIDGKQYMYVTLGDPDAAYTVAFVNDGTQFTGVPH